MTAVKSIVLATVLALAAGAADARSRNNSNGGVPELNVRGSCSDAQKFSTGDDKNNAFKGCMQDEMNAKSELAKRWSSFRAKDRSDCIEQSRTPSPSYVEVLTCLEMDTGALQNNSRTNSKPVPQIGGPLAPGLAAPKT